MGSNEIAISLKVTGLLDLIQGLPAKKTLTIDDGKAAKLHTITSPMRLGRRGNETRLILQNTGATQRPVDKSLLRSIARGYAWRHEIISGQIASASEIAKRESITTSFVSRLIDLSFLAPSILTAIARRNLTCRIDREQITVTWRYPSRLAKSESCSRFQQLDSAVPSQNSVIVPQL